MSCTANSLSSCRAGFNPGLLYPINWYAVYTYLRHDKSVGDHLVSQSVEAFLTTVITQRQWTDRRVRVEPPAFPGYVFTRISLSQKQHGSFAARRDTHLSFNGMLAAIDDNEIDNVRLCEGRGAIVKPQARPEVGDRVKGLLAHPQRSRGVYPLVARWAQARCTNLFD